MGLGKTDPKFVWQSKELRIHKIFMKNDIFGETYLQDNEGLL